MQLLFRTIFVSACLVAIAPVASSQETNQEIKTLIDEIRQIADLKLSPATQQSVIDTATRELQRIANPTLAVSVSEAGADAIAAKEVERPGSPFSHFHVHFADQTITSTIDYAGRISIPALGDLDVTASLVAQSEPRVELATDQQLAEFKVRLAATSVSTTSLHLSHGGQPLSNTAGSIAQALASGMLKPALALLDRIEFRVPTVVATSIDLPPVKTGGFDVDFEPKVLHPKFEIVAAAFLLDQGRLTVLAQDAGPPSTAAAPAVHGNFGVLRDAFKGLLDKAAATWMDQGDFAAFVDLAIVNRLTSPMLKAAPICAQAKAADVPVSVHEKLQLPPVSSIECTPDRECAQTRLQTQSAS